MRNNNALFDYRERQDADGQMKELQDQFEAEQYFSVSSYFMLCACKVSVLWHLENEPAQEVNCSLVACWMAQCRCEEMQLINITLCSADTV